MTKATDADMHACADPHAKAGATPPRQPELQGLAFKVGCIAPPLAPGQVLAIVKLPTRLQ